MERIQMNKLAKGISAACLLAFGASAHANIQGFSPSAYAEAALNLTNFTILKGNTTGAVAGQGNGAGRSGTQLSIDVLGGTEVRTFNVDSNGGSTSDLTSIAGSDVQNITGEPAGTPFAIYTNQGVGYVPNQHLGVGTLNPSSYVGGMSSTYGNALTPVSTAFPPVIPPLQPGNVSDAFQLGSKCDDSAIGDCIRVQSVVNLNQNDKGSGQSDQGLGVQVTLIPTKSQWFEIAFDAEGILRAAIGQDGVGNSADANFAWNLSVSVAQILTVDANGVPTSTGPSSNFLSWTPDEELGSGFGGGSCRTIATSLSGLGRDCFEYADSFSMSPPSVQALSTIVDNGDTNRAFSGNFEIEAFLASGFIYTLTIDHSTSANASVVAIPEPTSLALAGLGLIGAGVARRRKVAS